MMNQGKYDLRVLLFEITQKCNAKCDQCGSRCDIDSKEILTKEEILNVLKDVKQNLGTDMMINISGGEPLMRKDLFEIMTEATQMGFDWGMVTNGTLINDSSIQKMKTSGLKTITVSIDGLEETHETLRHLPKGSFYRTIEALKKLKSARFLDHIQITFTANKKNIYEIEELYDIVRDCVDSIRVSFIDPIGRAEDNKNLMLNRNEMQWLINFANRINKKSHGNVGLPYENTPPIIWGCCHFLNKKVKNRVFDCFTGKHSASILYNGDIFVCPNVPREDFLIQGNIKKDSFSDVWVNKFEYFRQEHTCEHCEGCKYKSKCNRDSMHTYDFKNHKPKFCYKDIFDGDMEEYNKYLCNKYGNYSIVEVSSEDEKARDIYIEPDAYKDMERYFHMGTEHPSSIYEQQMILAGFKIGKTYIIKYAVPSYVKRISGEVALFDKNTMKQVKREVQIINENIHRSSDKDDYIIGNIKFLGFAHSHPIQEELQYSVGDEKIHTMLAKEFGDYIGILVNPKNDLIGAYYGKEIKQGNLNIVTQID